MPCAQGVPMGAAQGWACDPVGPGDPSPSPGYIGVNHPPNWLDGYGNEMNGVQQSAVMRGHPPALAWQQQRPAGRHLVPQGTPAWLQSRPYDRGAGAYAPKFGVLTVNPIGAGIYAPYKLPPFAGPGARYQAGAIWFDVQAVPTSVRMSPTMPAEAVSALIAQAHVAAAYYGS